MNMKEITLLYEKLFDQVRDNTIINVLMDYNCKPPLICLELESPDGERTMWRVQGEHHCSLGVLEKV